MRYRTKTQKKSFTIPPYRTHCQLAKQGRTKSARFSVNGENFQLELEEVYSLADGTLLGFVSVDDSGTGSATFFLADQSSISSIEVSAAKLASEVEDITSTNSIIVGLPCDHYLLREVGKEEGSCDYKRKIGYIESYVLPNGKVSIVISGRTGDDRLLAASALAKFQENKESLKGQSLEVVEDNGAIIIKPRSRAGNGTSSQEANRDNLELTIKIAGFLIAAVIVFVFLWRKKDSQILGRKMPNRKEKPKRTFK